MCRQNPAHTAVTEYIITHVIKRRPQYQIYVSSVYHLCAAGHCYELRERTGTRTKLINILYTCPVVLSVCCRKRHPFPVFSSLKRTLHSFYNSKSVEQVLPYEAKIHSALKKEGYLLRNVGSSLPCSKGHSILEPMNPVCVLILHV